MNTFAIYKPSGEIYQTIATSEESLVLPLELADYLVALAPEGLDTSAHYVDESGMVCAMPARPGSHHAFDWAAKEWADPRTLQDLRDAKWAEIKQARAAAFTAPLVTPFGIFQADDEGQENISRAVLLANNLTALGYPVGIDFTLADDTIRVMNAPAMVQVGLLLGGRVQLIRAHATALRAQIESATADQLSEVAWPAN